MLTDRIQEKLRELSTLPGVTAVGLGKKIIGGPQTDTIGISFSVKVKEANPESMLPTSVDIDGVTYVTDVVEIGEIEFAACPATPVDPTPYERYVVSGMSFINTFSINSATNNQGIRYAYNGTFGFVAYHTQRKVLVGVTAAHLLYDASIASADNRKTSVNAFFAQNSASGYAQFNYPYVFQNYFVNGAGQAYNYIAGLLSYEPLKVKPVTDPSRFNQVDACLSFFIGSNTLTAVIPDFVGATASLELDPFYNSSWRSYHVKGIPEITSPMPFATTAELNALISSPPSQVSSSGSASGPKHGLECGLKIDTIGETLNFTSSTMTGPVYFDQLITFSRITPGLPTVLNGDSGASLIAKIGGVWKIIGLVIGGNQTVGYACRIDKLAEQLGIEAWDGSVKPTGINRGNFLSSFGAMAVAPGTNDAQEIIIDGRIYNQIGTTTLSALGYYE